MLQGWMITAFSGTCLHPVVRRFLFLGLREGSIRSDAAEVWRSKLRSEDSVRIFPQCSFVLDKKYHYFYHLRQWNEDRPLPDIRADEKR